MNLISYDINANKQVDRYVSFTQKDSIREAMNDFNEDGAMDDWQLFFTNGMSIRMVDVNLDRKFDSVEVINQKNGIMKKYSMSDFLNKVKE